jgi:hypothetical protein
MNKHQNKNDHRVEPIYLAENKNNGAKNNLEKLDEDEKIENKTGERNDERIMNSVIVKMENESERKECENIKDEYENKEESDGESESDHYSKYSVDMGVNSKNEQHRESDSTIMETKHIENSDIVKSEKEGKNEQISNGGTQIILKDDEKTVNKNDYIDKPTTNKKEKNKSKSGERKKKKRQKKKSINNEIHATCDEKEVKPNNTGHYDKITPVYDNVTAVYDNVTPVSID